jgi:hypothetical protein
LAHGIRPAAAIAAAPVSDIESIGMATLRNGGPVRRV